VLLLTPLQWTVRNYSACFSGLPFCQIHLEKHTLALELVNTFVFGSQPIEVWSKPLLRPHLLLGIPRSKVLEFEISSLVTLDHIWLARNKLVRDENQPSPPNTLSLEEFFYFP